MFASLTNRENWQRYLKSLKFALYCTTHPLDGFWDLTHEKRGTLAAANTILFVSVFLRILKLKYTSFVVTEPVYWEELNILTYIASIVFPLALFVIGNWALTTLFDGKGNLRNVYIATCYALTPYPLIQLPIMILSNFVSADEAAFYSVLSLISMIWVLYIGIFGMSQVHDFSFGKNLLFMVATVFAMLVMVFILMLFFSMISQGVAYFISLTKEFLYRV